MIEVMDIRTDPELLAALRKVYAITPEEIREQYVSFVWSCLDISSPLRKEDVRRIISERYHEPQTGAGQKT